jgi:hypothetical protein
MGKCKPRGRRPVSKRWVKVVRFLPCFFDVPVKRVYSILNISHHTLDPMRRAFNLPRWPYSDVVHGKFYMTQEEIAELRINMMSHANESMQEILIKMAICAEECKEKNGIPPFEAKKAKSEESKQEDPTKDIPLFLDEPEDTESAQEFWEDISRIFMLGEVESEPRQQQQAPDP